MGHEDDADAHWRSHHFTTCVVDMEEAMVMFPALFLQRRRDLVGHLTEEEWLNRHGRQVVELESVEFSRRYELLADGHLDRLALRELFSPSFIVWLAEHPLAPCFEYRAGTLVVVRARSADRRRVAQPPARRHAPDRGAPGARRPPSGPRIALRT